MKTLVKDSKVGTHYCRCLNKTSPSLAEQLDMLLFPIASKWNVYYTVSNVDVYSGAVE